MSTFYISSHSTNNCLLFFVCVSRLGQNLQRLCLQLLVRSLCRPCSHRCYWALPSLPLVMSSRCVSSMACPAPTALTTQASWSPHLHTCSRLCRHTYSIYLTTAQALTTWWGKFTLKCKYVYPISIFKEMLFFWNLFSLNNLETNVSKCAGFHKNIKQPNYFQHW